MKTDTLELDTQKSVQEIKGILNSFKKCETSPLNITDGSEAKPSLAVLMVGKATFKDALKHYGAGKSEWGVQVCVYEMGSCRHVVLVALGESAIKAGLSAYGRGGGFFGDVALANKHLNIRHSKDYRGRIASLLA